MDFLTTGDQRMIGTRLVCTIVVCSFLAGCSTTPEDLEKSASTKSGTRTFSENYQEIYRRVSTNAKRCLAGDIAFSFASNAVDAELYSELGFGEITLSLVNAGLRNYYWKARIERQGSGSKMTVSAGNTIRNAANVKQVFAWAGGATGC